MTIKTIVQTMLIGFGVVGIMVTTASGKNPISSTVRAFGDLNVEFGIPPEDPLFSIMNIAPGQTIEKSVVVHNDGDADTSILAKGIKTSSEGEALDTILELSIHESGSLLYQDTLSTFFQQSDTLGVMLATLASDASETYDFSITFPASAGNQYQSANLMFDLMFGEYSAENVVINEVYYQVDEKHGFDSPKDRGIDTINGNQVSVTIEGNGVGSTNTVSVSFKDLCKISQNNNINLSNVVSYTAETGQTQDDRNSISQFTSIFNFGGFNLASCRSKLLQNHEWVELYNPTDRNISLKGWSLTDNSGITTHLKNKTIKPGHMLLVTKHSSTWKYWNEEGKKMYLKMDIGDGLDNDSDHLVLKDAQGNVVDFVPWNGGIAQGSSITRNPNGFDTDQPTDWITQPNPSPGS